MKTIDIFARFLNIHKASTTYSRMIITSAHKLNIHENTLCNHVFSLPPQQWIINEHFVRSIEMDELNKLWQIKLNSLNAFSKLLNRTISVN